MYAKKNNGGPGRENRVLRRRPRFLVHPSTAFIEHTFLHLLPCKLGFALHGGGEKTTLSGKRT